MSETNVEERREARRRKILENSEKRLQRITGVQKRNASFELEGYKSSQNIEDENLIENHVHNRSLATDDFIPNGNTLPPQLETPLLNSFIQSRSSVLNTNQLSSTRTYKIPIILGIACLLNVLLFVFPHAFLLNTIFIPLLCFEAIDLFYNRHSDTNNELINILRLVFKNIPPNYLSLVIKYFSLTVTVTRDVMIYFFAFVCIWFIRDVLLGI